MVRSRDLCLRQVVLRETDRQLVFRLPSSRSMVGVPVFLKESDG